MWYSRLKFMTKSLSPLTIAIKQFNKRIFDSDKKCINSDRNLIKKIGNKSDRKNLNFISPHSRTRAATKRRTITQRKINRISISKIRNKSSLNRVLRTINPPYFRVIWMVERNSDKINISYNNSGLIRLTVCPWNKISKIILEKAVIKSFLNLVIRVTLLFRILRINKSIIVNNIRVILLK